MNEDERIAKVYLEHMGFQSVVYEPDGNGTPDFLCNDNIAVEVRRLNQQEDITNSKSRGLEELSIPLFKDIERILVDLGQPKDNHSWFVSYRFSRPVLPRKELNHKIREALQVFRDNDSDKRKEMTLTINDRFVITITRASKVIDNQFFALGLLADRDSSGFLTAKMQENLQFCIDEKTKKISDVRHKYSVWWLVLTNHISKSIDNFDQEELRSCINLDDSWEKVILIDPRDPTLSFEIK